mmetsp:Transcript_12896/g.34745  ORF Transcript_12896/g.34745 Transcript_12896/m.34745 type:complete len:207 (+) Transcript_12896:143-763(+)
MANAFFQAATLESVSIEAPLAFTAVASGMLKTPPTSNSQSSSRYCSFSSPAWLPSSSASLILGKSAVAAAAEYLRVTRSHARSTLLAWTCAPPQPPLVACRSSCDGREADRCIWNHPLDVIDDSSTLAHGVDMERAPIGGTDDWKASGCSSGSLYSTSASEDREDDGDDDGDGAGAGADASFARLACAAHALECGSRCAWCLLAAR